MAKSGLMARNRSVLRNRGIEISVNCRIANYLTLLRRFLFSDLSINAQILITPRTKVNVVKDRIIGAAIKAWEMFIFVPSISVVGDRK